MASNEHPGGTREVIVSGAADAFAQTIRVGPHTLSGDEPTEVGGTDTGPNPYDFLLSALGTCTSMTLGMYARHKGWPLERVTVRLRQERVHAKDCEDCESETGFVTRIQREVTVEGPLDDAQKQRLLEIANRCPVHRTLTAEIKVDTTLAASSE